MSSSISIFEEFGIYPKLLKDIPEKVVGIKYPDGSQVDFGNELTPTAVRYFPDIVFESDRNLFYTLVMVDFGPIHANNTSVLHWLVVNIPGDNIRIGETIAEYLNPAPSKRSGYRRYVFLVYEQKEAINPGIDFISKSIIDTRLGFKLDHFTQKNNLGKAVAINFFVAKWDDFSRIILKSWPSLDASN